MPDFYMDVDTALAEVPVNIMPLIDDTDFKTIEDSIAYNAAGMDLRWNFVTTTGAMTSTAVTPTTSGNYDWASQGDGMYSIEIPASGGASINNDTEGFGWFSGKVTGVLPWRGPTIGFRSATINDALIDGSANLLVQLANGVTHGGATAKIELGSSSSTPALLVQNSGGTAARMLSSGGSGHGLHLDGVNNGLLAEGDNDAVKFQASGGRGLHLIAGGGNWEGLRTAGSGSGSGILVDGGSTDGIGIEIYGNDSAAGVQIIGGATGDGLLLLGGATSGDALRAAAQGIGDGFQASGAGGGVDIRAGITGNITGNLSGSVGSVTALSAGAVDSIHDDTIGDGTITFRQQAKLSVAVDGGKLSGAATTNVLIRDAADSVNVVNATVDANGNRTAVTLTL